MSGDAHVQFWESLGVRFPGATHPEVELPTSREQKSACGHVSLSICSGRLEVFSFSVSVHRQPD